MSKPNTQLEPIKIKVTPAQIKEIRRQFTGLVGSTPEELSICKKATPNTKTLMLSRDEALTFQSKFRPEKVTNKRCRKGMLNLNSKVQKLILQHKDYYLSPLGTKRLAALKDGACNGAAFIVRSQHEANSLTGNEHINSIADMYEFVAVAIEDPDGFNALNTKNGQPIIKTSKATAFNGKYDRIIKFLHHGIKDPETGTKQYRIPSSTLQRYGCAMRYAYEEGWDREKFHEALSTDTIRGIEDKFRKKYATHYKSVTDKKQAIIDKKFDAFNERPQIVKIAKSKLPKEMNDCDYIIALGNQDGVIREVAPISDKEAATWIKRLVKLPE